MRVLPIPTKVLTLVVALILSTFIAITATKVSAAPVATWYENPDVPSGYLAQQDSGGHLIHMIGGDTYGTNQGGINTDYWTTTDGEYCNYYNIGDFLGQTNINNLFNYTGFDPGGTRTNWQIGDNSENVCQAQGDTWGFSITGNLNGNCTSPNLRMNDAPCGMHKFVRFSGGQSNKPFSDSYISTNSAGQPALTFDVKAKIKSASGNGGAFGYFCPIFQDTVNSPYRYVEFCAVEWKKNSGFPSVGYDAAHCADTNPWGSNLDTVFTAFDSTRSMATLKPSSTVTFALSGATDYNTYRASITKANMQNAVNAINATCLGHTFNTDVTNYALVGFEHGLEGRDFGLLGGSVKDENIYTTSDTLYPGDKLFSGQTLKSNSGVRTLTLQEDGNLVMKYNGSVAWHANTSGQLVSTNNIVRYELEMQSSDGNLVLYKVFSNGTRSAIWWKNAAGAGSFATLQDDGNFVQYQKSTTAYWWTGVF